MNVPDLGAWLRAESHRDGSLSLAHPLVGALHEELQRLRQSNARMRKQNAKLRRRIARLKGEADPSPEDETDPEEMIS